MERRPNESFKAYKRRQRFTRNQKPVHRVLYSGIGPYVKKKRSPAGFAKTEEVILSGTNQKVQVTTYTRKSNE